MRSAGPDRPGLRLLRDGLRGSRASMWRIAGWSALEAAPAFASGWALASALDRGFLAGKPVAGLAWLGLLAAMFGVRAIAERAMFPHLADVVEPLRDHLVRRLVEATLATAVNSAGPPDAAGVSRLTRQIETVRGLSATLLRTARPLAVTMVATIAGLAVLSPVAAVLVLLPLTLALASLALSLPALVGRRRALILADERVTARVGAALEAGRDIAALGAEEQAVAAVADATGGAVEAAARVGRFDAQRVLVVLLGGHIPLLALLVAGPALVTSGALTAGALVGAVAYISRQLVPALRMLVGTVGGYWTQLGVALTRLAEATECPPEAPSEAVPPPAGFARVVEDVTYRYGPHAEPVVDGLSIAVPPGDHVAIVGASGIGKSTVANLLSGIARPELGSVCLGGVPTSKLIRSPHRDTIALVPQEAYVFAGTLRDNLRYLNPRATDRELDRALRLLGVAAVVDRLGGLDVHMPNPAARLSSGEGQLIVLARVYVSPARVVILDEATCHLDPTAEARAERAFAERPGTLIVIAHRIASARRARRILLLDGARAYLGTHAELLTSSPNYAEMVGHWATRPVTTSPSGGSVLG